ncbi:prolyl oligopeptidase family serine peptidase [Pseudomaricurvus alkylphenolicus]|uniref:S9 family peptidase n=1 Tax=Pseudomaricurvus alkylphenolicus TaxID=1306991 RepID=UPI001420066E|nr:DPP IV N-terminal domain-containing protein [Pseudomaricurvus alkylphenolicus]NIB44909.1 prolyl oligopeptidase family serine peptidase [Pseudomaricurvus alkylphenolicus]
MTTLSKTLTPQDYDRAFELWPTELSKKALNTLIEPHWLGADSSYFWYLKQERNGHRFIMVDAETGSQQPAFDHHLVAEGLRAITQISVEANKLPFTHFELDCNANCLSVMVSGQHYQCDLNSGQCTELPVKRPSKISPNGRYSAYIKDHNLWLEDREGASDSRSHRQLSNDGEALCAYGTMPDHDRMAVFRARGVLPPLPPVGTFWSPDSSKILCFRADSRKLESYPFVESVPQDGSCRPLIHPVRLPMPGDEHRLAVEFVLFDLNSSTGGCRQLKLPANWGELVINAVSTEAVFWRPDGSEVFLLAQTPDGRRSALVCVDTAAASLRVVYEEQCSTFSEFGSFEYHSPNVTLLFEQNCAVWYSQSSGYGHLYLIDLGDGRKPAFAKRAITEGNWSVLDLIGVDEGRQQLFFTAGSTKPGVNPYFRQLMRVDLGGDKPNYNLTQLTADGQDHAIPGKGLALMALLSGSSAALMLSPSFEYFVDNSATLGEPTKTVIRNRDGELIADLEEADIVALETAGWRAPEPFSINLKDTDEPICGVLIKPRNFDPEHSYPIVERIYAGPQIIAQPRNIHEALNGAFMYGVYTLAEMGFVVVVMDGPGTPLRSKQFQDLPYGKEDRLGVGYHAQVIEKLAAERPWMDLDHVGVNGHSWGGHASAMAMLLQASTYTVGVSSAGIYDPAAFFTDSSEKYLGSADYGDGRQQRNRPEEQPENYVRMSPSTYGNQLQGHLLLAYGDLDENALPCSLLRFSASLTAEQKAHDLLYLSGRSHALFAEPYFHKRLLDYFIEHLQHRKPLLHYPIDVPVGNRPLI